jgi:uncharacterized protein (TIGR02453 family)
MATATRSKTKTDTDGRSNGTRAAAASARERKSAPVSVRARKIVKGKEAIAPFEGFPKDFFPFFRELARNNNREWFAINKERYLRTVQAPILSFIAAMDLPLGRFADCFVCEAKANGGSMFRIYNDMRFHDAKPYKEHAACQFRHVAGKDAHAPGFYVHFEPKEVFFGGGLWRPPSPELRKVREAIVADPERWTKITRAPAFKRRFGGVEGDSLKRAPLGFDPDDPLIEDLRRVSFFAIEEVKPAEIHSKDFAKQVARSFEALSPFMKFLTDAVGLPYHQDI